MSPLVVGTDAGESASWMPADQHSRCRRMVQPSIAGHDHAWKHTSASMMFSGCVRAYSAELGQCPNGATEAATPIHQTFGNQLLLGLCRRFSLEAKLAKDLACARATSDVDARATTVRATVIPADLLAAPLQIP